MICSRPERLVVTHSLGQGRCSHLSDDAICPELPRNDQFQTPNARNLEKCVISTFRFQAPNCPKIGLIYCSQMYQVIHDAMLLLRSCLDSGMLGASCFVNVLWTKYDFVAAAHNGEHASFLEKATQEFQKQFSSRVGKLSFRRVAARPADVDGLEFGYGLPELLQEWATESP